MQIMTNVAFLKTVFFLFWPFLLIGIILLSKKLRKKSGPGTGIWNH